MIMENFFSGIREYAGFIASTALVPAIVVSATSLVKTLYMLRVKRKATDEIHRQMELNAEIFERIRSLSRSDKKEDLDRMADLIELYTSSFSKMERGVIKEGLNQQSNSGRSRFTKELVPTARFADISANSRRSPAT